MHLRIEEILQYAHWNEESNGWIKTDISCEKISELCNRFEEIKQNSGKNDKKKWKIKIIKSRIKKSLYIS